MRAFALTTDGIFAMLIMLLAVIFIAVQPAPQESRDIYLKQISSDTITVLEKSGKLSRVIAGNSTEIREILDALPRSICADVLVSRENGNSYVVGKPGCSGYKKQLQVARRWYRYNDSNYIAEVRSWSE